MDAKVCDVMTPDPIALPSTATLVEAAGAPPVRPASARAGASPATPKAEVTGP